MTTLVASSVVPNSFELPSPGRGQLANHLKPRIIHHSLVTQSYETQIYEAAASLQLQFGQSDDDQKSEDLLIASPYNDPLHLLDLRTLDTPNRLFALALTVLKPIRDDYATHEYTKSLNWTAVMAFLRDLAAMENYAWTRQTFYVVTFRSKKVNPPTRHDIHELDAISHQEAMASGGLLKYWFGTPNKDSRNLATCIWRSEEDAQRGGAGPGHARARAAARDLYEQISFTRLRLVIEDGVGSWGFSSWKDE